MKRFKKGDYVRVIGDQFYQDLYGGVIFRVMCKNSDRTYTLMVVKFERNNIFVGMNEIMIHVGCNEDTGLEFITDNREVLELTNI